MRYVMGVDTGIASVGWAVINEDKQRIENLGVRTFKKAEESDGKALNLARREARGARRRIRRRAVRMKKVKQALIKYQIVTEAELEKLYGITKTEKDVWQLRAEGLSKKLDRKEWARVLTSIAKRRGYQSNRKIDIEEKEVGTLSKGTMENKRILEEKGYQTIGEMFYKDEKFKNNKRNKGGEYNNTVLRSMLIDEIRQLFEVQRTLDNPFANRELEEEYLEIVTYQKPYLTPELLEKMLGTCTFEKEEHRAPKNSYTFERFMLLQKINHLRVEINGEIIQISKEQREEIEKLAYNQAEITYTQLRKKLNLRKEARFTDLNYNQRKKKEEEQSEEERTKQVEDTRFIKLEGWHKIRTELKANQKEEKFEYFRKNPKLQNIIADALVRNKTDEGIKRYLQGKEIDEQIIEAVLNINFTKFGHLSYKAMEKIIPELEKGLTYDKACETVGYELKGAKNVLQDKLPPLSQADANILNPVVLRAVSQTRKVINAIIEQYGSPTAIYIETARELSKSFEEREKIKERQKENTVVNEKIKEHIKENFHFEPKPFDIVKMKLWKEQNGMCAYSQKNIPAERLYEENFVQVDHIIPFSRCFDDSYQNKVLVLTDENQRKGEKTPFEYFGQNEEKWHAFEEFVKITYQFNTKKRENMLIKKVSEEKEFIQRNLNDTRYIAKFMYDYITNNLKFAESEKKRKVYNINGQATAILRRYWGLKKDRAKSDKHHAQDAVVIACASNQNIKKISEYVKAKNKQEKEMILKEPWPKFREEVELRMEQIFVSRMPERKITGRAHKDTMRSQKFIKQGYDFTVVKKSLKSISKDEIERIITNPKYRILYLSDKATYDGIYERMKQANFKAEKAFATEYRKNSKTGNGPIVRSIKVPEKGKAGVKLRNGAIAENANMVRVDVFEKDKQYYLVPIYVSDFSKKKLPNKAIAIKKEEEEWLELTEEYIFKFSLYPNDLVKIKKKNESEFYGYYVGTDRSSASIEVIAHDASKQLRGIGVKRLEIFEKYQVDILGNISKVKKEKREGVY